MKPHVIVGTSGHIDHGKSTLVRALTGIDPGTLPEEKARGLTIELGFVFLDDPDYEKQIVFIDVPGHEKFVRTMAAGASNVDAALLIVAADEGVNVQTREHFDILRLLEIPAGIVVPTKIDLADEARSREVEAEIRALVAGSFLDGAPILPVSAATGEGMDKLRTALRDLGRSVRPREDRGLFRMPIDRVFVLQGFGTVVAGTVLGGEVRVGDKVEIYPDGLTARVRNIHVHGEIREKAGIGLRTALNLMDLKKDDLRRGQCAARPGTLEPTERLDLRLRVLERYGKDVKNRERVRIHVGTDEIIARLAILDRGVLRPGETAPVQAFLESPTAALPGDRFVVRAFSPQATLGGGRVVDARPARHRRLDDRVIDGLKRLEGGLEDAVEETVRKCGFGACGVLDAARSLGADAGDVERAAETLCGADRLVRVPGERGVLYIHPEAFRLLSEKTAGLVKAYLEKNPHRPAMPFAELRAEFLKWSGPGVFPAVLDALCRSGVLEKKDRDVGLPGRDRDPDRKRREAQDRVELIYRRAGLAAPLEEDVMREAGLQPRFFREILYELARTGVIVRLGPKVTYHRDALARAREAVSDRIRRTGGITIAELRDKLDLSRKYACAILEYFDKIGFTRRSGDRHVLK
ncbi:MAG: selenocysteine-specific translation elongation factor [Acidobacteriota bacterium]|nr:selenocysteine-specific translation elongation factor [Acidobacteriota bacterium]